MAALTHAFEIEPENGQVQSMLARLYCNAYSLEVPGFEEALGKALALAERGVVLSPDSRRAHGVLAYVRMIKGDIEQACFEVERAIALNSNSYFVLDGLAYLLTLLGEWERGTSMIRKIIRLNPYYLFTLHHALWLDWFRQGEYTQAYRETLNFKRPALFWEPLMKAATLGHLARIDEGKKNVGQLLELKPDFAERARVLIGHYIKFDDIIESILSGLAKSGLKIR
jgi:tetratricopeptide (TPR) repeat protein